MEKRHSADQPVSRSPFWHYLLFLIIPLVAGCTSNSQREYVDKILIYPDDSDPVPKHDLTLTWRNFMDGLGHHHEAELILDEFSLGKGDSAVLDLLLSLSSRSEGTRILIYPRYPYSMAVEPAGEVRTYPFMHSFEVLESVARQKGIILIFSPRDPSGKLLKPSKKNP